MEISRGKIEGAQKVVIYAPEGIGKSTFASKFPDPVFIDTEGSTKKLDVARTKPNPSSWTMLLDQVRYFIKNPHSLGTLITDTADWAEKLCISDVCAKHGKGGIEDFGYGKGPVYVVEEFGKLLNLLTELIDKGVNVVLVAHAATRKFDLPEETGTFDKWEMKLTKFTGPLVKEWADMILFVNYKTYVVQTGDGMNKKNKAQGGKRVMYTTHHPCWDAKNRHDLAEELAFDFSAIAHCIPVRGASVTPPVQTKVETTPTVAAAVAPTTTAAPAAPSTTEPAAPGLTDVPTKALADLMKQNNVTVQEIQQAVASKGYYPANTPIANYDPNFINGVLVAAWPQVFGMIQNLREPIGEEDVPF